MRLNTSLSRNLGTNALTWLQKHGRDQIELTKVFSIISGFEPGEL